MPPPWQHGMAARGRATDKLNVARRRSRTVRVSAIMTDNRPASKCRFTKTITSIGRVGFPRKRFRATICKDCKASKHSFIGCAGPVRGWNSDDHWR